MDPRGYTVVLSQDRYDQHIIGESGHNEVLIQDIMGAVENPQLIYGSCQYTTRDIYFAKTSSTYPLLYVKVPVNIDEEKKEGTVVTAFLVKTVKGGIDEENGPKYINYHNKL